MKWMKWGAAALGALAAAGAIAFAIISFAGTASAKGPNESADRYRQLLAAQLGISVDKLQSAETTARNQLADELAAKGAITTEQAAKIKSAPAGSFGLGLGLGHLRAKAGAMIRTDVIAVVASTAHISTDQVKTELQGGKTLAQIGSDHGVPRDTMENAIIAAWKADLQKAVTNNSITQAQADTIAYGLSQHVDRILDGMKFGRGHRGFGGPGMPPASGTPAAPGTPRTQ